MTNHTHKPSRSYQVPTFTPGSRGVHVKAFSKRTASTANSAQPAIEPAISRLLVAQATTELRRPTWCKLFGITTLKLSVLTQMFILHCQRTCSQPASDWVRHIHRSYAGCEHTTVESTSWRNIVHSPAVSVELCPCKSLCALVFFFFFFFSFFPFAYCLPCLDTAAAKFWPILFT